MPSPIRLLDVVALTTSLTEPSLARGQVGTVVEELAPQVYLVEFSDKRGQAFAITPVPADKLLVLHYELAEAV